MLDAAVWVFLDVCSVHSAYTYHAERERMAGLD